MAKASKEKKLVPNEDDKGLKMSMKKGDDKSKSRVPLQKKVKAPTIENYKENVIIDGLSAVDPFKPLIRLFSWNINGARALVKKEDSVEFYQNVIHHPEFCTIGLQEIKCDDKSLPAEIDCTEDYESLSEIAYSKEKKGYSGVFTLSKTMPLSVSSGLGHEIFDNEGRLITLEFKQFYFVTAYVPNSGDGLKRIDERCNEWESKLREHLAALDKKKPVIYTGDLNVACSAIELANPKNNYNKSAGYTQREIDEFDSLIESGFTDAYRHFYPEKTGAYTYWGYRFNARAKNTGWRLDYFIVSDRLVPALVDVIHHTSVMGSDHCPIELQVDKEQLEEIEIKGSDGK